MIALLLVALSCGPKAPPIPEEDPVALNPEAIAGVTDPTLQRLLHDEWEYTMYTYPVWATMLGDHRYDDRVGDASMAAVMKDRETTRTFLLRAQSIDAGTLSEADRLTLSLFTHDMQDSIDREVCEFWQWNVSPRENALVDASFVSDAHQFRSPADGVTYLSRIRALPEWVDDQTANLRTGIGNGRVPNAESVRLMVEQIGKEIERPVDEWALAKPATDEVDFEWPERDAFAADLRAAVDRDLRAAFVRYHAFLRDELLPVARPAEKAGLGGLPDGVACYEALVRSYTTLPLTADGIHDAGLTELVHIHAQMRDVGERIAGTRDLEAIFAKLRSDPTLGYDTPEAVEADATAAVDSVRPKLPEYFGRLPKADVVVRPIPDYEAPYTTIAYYRHPSPDGSKPGEYFINTYDPASRPRWQARALAFHEAIPGHHLQIAIAMELPEVPAFRRYEGYTAFVEGWGLYAEGIADEMGLYPTDLDEMGRLAFDSWRASRLVVDTGIHAQGWTREQAVAFMLANTPLAENNIVNEVDRYITTPGQALAYKTGELYIRRLRADADQTLGPAFDLAEFHDVVLGAGALPLGVLRERVDAWVAEQRVEGE